MTEHADNRAGCGPRCKDGVFTAWDGSLWRCPYCRGAWEPLDNDGAAPPAPGHGADPDLLAVLRDLRDAYADHLDRWCRGDIGGTRHLPLIKADELLGRLDRD